MRFVIYGAGGIGGTIGARLHMSGYAVQLIARGEHGQRLRDSGLHFIAPGIDEVLQIPTVLHPKQVTWAADDVVLLCMKSQHTQAALDDLRNADVWDLPIVCVQNGVANEAAALRCFPKVYAMLVFLPALHVQPGEVITNAHDAGGVLDVGCYPQGTDEVVEQLAQALCAAGFSAKPDPAIMAQKYAKLLTNLGNSLSALTDMAPGSEQIMRQLKREALACYAAAGIDATPKEAVAQMQQVVQQEDMPQFPRGGGSSWQSVLRGTGNIEADFLNGEICKLGESSACLHPQTPRASEWRCSSPSSKIRQARLALPNWKRLLVV